MNIATIDASVALKWVVSEPGTEAALALRRGAKLIAPDILLADCADLLLRKVARGELEKGEALLAGRLLQAAGVELVSTRLLLEPAMLIALDLHHPAHDCLYVALAAARSCRFVTLDAVLMRKARVAAYGAWSDRVISLQEATGAPSENGITA